MVKNLLSVFFLSLLTIPVFAQVKNGYYRVKNVASERYIYLIDNNGWVKLDGANITHDLDCIVLRKNLEYSISDPSSIVKVTRISGNSYDLSLQGVSVKNMTGHNINVIPSGTHYTVGASQSGVNATLGDVTTSLKNQYGKIDIKATKDFLLWDPIAVSSTGDNYFGVAPKVNSESLHFASFYAEFGFEVANSDMHVYVVSSVDENLGTVSLREVSGVIPNSTPVLISCPSENPSDNRLNLIDSKSSVSGNKLTGIYFNYSNQFLKDGKVPETAENPSYEKYYKYSVKLHENKTPYDPQTMRVLGLDKEGKLAFVKADIDYLPANSAYLKVSSSAPESLTVLTDQDSSIESVFESSSCVETYNLLGKKIDTSNGMPAGIYIINGKKTIIR